MAANQMYCSVTSTVSVKLESLITWLGWFGRNTKASTMVWKLGFWSSIQSSFPLPDYTSKQPMYLRKGWLHPTAPGLNLLKPISTFHHPGQNAWMREEGMWSIWVLASNQNQFSREKVVLSIAVPVSISHVSVVPCYLNTLESILFSDYTNS